MDLCARAHLLRNCSTQHTFTHTCEHAYMHFTHTCGKKDRKLTWPQVTVTSMSQQLFHLAARYQFYRKALPSSQAHFRHLPFDMWHCPVEKMQKNGHCFTTKETKARGRKAMLLERGTLKVKIQIFWAQTHCVDFHFKLNSDQGKTLIISKLLAMASTLFLLPRWCIYFLR